VLAADISHSASLNDWMPTLIIRLVESINRAIFSGAICRWILNLFNIFAIREFSCEEITALIELVNIG
jgi:hypothetical protein